MQEYEAGWKTRSTGEMKIIIEEEKKERLSRVAGKHKKFGKKLDNKKIDKNDELTERTRKRLMLSEAQENYWKYHRDGTRMMKQAGRRVPRRIVPDKNMSLQEYLEDLRQEGDRKSREIKENWK